MTVSLLEICLLLLINFVMCLSCMALGAFVVFRTKRESYEGMFTHAQPAGDALVVDDLGAELSEEEQADAAKDLMERFEKRNVEFLSQFAKRQQGAGGE